MRRERDRLRVGSGDRDLDLVADRTLGASAAARLEQRADPRVFAPVVGAVAHGRFRAKPRGSAPASRWRRPRVPVSSRTSVASGRHSRTVWIRPFWYATIFDDATMSRFSASSSRTRSLASSMNWLKPRMNSPTSPVASMWTVSRLRLCTISLSCGTGGREGPHAAADQEVRQRRQQEDRKRQHPEEGGLFEQDPEPRLEEADAHVGDVPPRRRATGAMNSRTRRPCGERSISRSPCQPAGSCGSGASAGRRPGAVTCARGRPSAVTIGAVGEVRVVDAGLQHVERALSSRPGARAVRRASSRARGPGSRPRRESVRGARPTWEATCIPQITAITSSEPRSAAARTSRPEIPSAPRRAARGAFHRASFLQFSRPARTTRPPILSRDLPRRPVCRWETQGRATRRTLSARPRSTL